MFECFRYFLNVFRLLIYSSMQFARLDVIVAFVLLLLLHGSSITITWVMSVRLRFQLTSLSFVGYIHIRFQC